MAAAAAAANNPTDMIIYAPQMSIVHLTDLSKPKPATLDQKKVAWELIDHPVHPQSGGPKVANLVQVSWLDIGAVFRFQAANANASLDGGKFKVKWHINLNGPNPDAVVVDTEFRVVVYHNDEDPSSNAVTQDCEPAILFKPRTLAEFMRETSRPNTVPARPTTMREAMELQNTPGYDANQQGFFTLTLPGEIEVKNQDQHGGVVVQIRNHSGIPKAGLQIESVELVPV